MLPDSDPRYVNQTYLAIRIALVLLCFMLLAALVLAVWGADDNCSQNSISAYFYTPARAVFIAALCAMGTCLIVYRGNDDVENAILDVSGYLAFVVAFVPTGAEAPNSADPLADALANPAAASEILEKTCGTSNVPAYQDIDAAVQVSIPPLLLVGVLANVIGWVLLHKGFGMRRAVLGRSRVRVILSISLVGLLTAGIAYYWRRESFIEYGHIAAAISLFIGLFGVVVINACEAGAGLWKRVYVSVAVYMVAAGMFIGVYRGFVDVEFNSWVYWLEVLLIAGFFAFWIGQSWELGVRADRDVARPSNPPSMTPARPVEPDGA